MSTAILRRLTSAGNTLVVVEHDPQVMLAGERLIDLGPGLELMAVKSFMRDRPAAYSAPLQKPALIFRGKTH